MIESTINGIFPTPIYISKLDRELTKKELSFVDKSKLDHYKNDGNITSNDNYILNQKVFGSLKEDLYLRVEDYFNKVLSYYRFSNSLYYSILVKLYRNKSVPS
jgi:hypothetical protein